MFTLKPITCYNPITKGVFYMSKADLIFINNIREILSNGYDDSHLDVRPRWSDGAPAHTIKKFCLVNRYDLTDEFPILTIRKTFYKNAIDELLWIWQKKSNNVRFLKSHIWDSWADEDGSIGKAYGYQLGVKHKYKEGDFDQVDRVIYDLKNNPQSRRILTNIYVHQDLHEMNLYPCAYSMTFNVSGNKLNGILNQRSQDMLTANNWNVVQYSVLLHMLAKVTGLEAGELVHVIADAHIYDRHVPIVKEIIVNKQFDAPIFKINERTNNFYDFKVDDFSLIDYNYSPLDQKIEVAI
jgi:thymidylate synthase